MNLFDLYFTCIYIYNHIWWGWQGGATGIYESKEPGLTQCHFPAFFLLVTSLYCIKFSNYFTLTIKNLLNQTLSYRILVLKWWILGFCTCICPIYQTAYREWLGVLCRGLVNLGLVTPYPRLASVFHEITVNLTKCLA